MTDVAVPHKPQPGEHGWTSTGVSSEKLGMWVFLGSECLLFGGLISTYLLYKNTAEEGPMPVQLYDIPFTSVSSFVLLMNSMTMVLALSAIQRGDHQRTRLWLVTTALLGSTFIAGQVYEFTTFVKEGMGYTTNTAASAFYTLTGFHGVHVSLGIVMLMSLFMMSLRGRLPEARSEVVEIVGLYWHFVDVVWIVIFTVVYLIRERHMSTTEEHVDDLAEEHGHAHPSDAQYIGIAAILAALTAVEVATYYIDTFKDHFELLILTLIPLMVVKFGIVAAFFMHLRFDNKLFRRVFLTGIILAVTVYVIVLSTFHVFLHANR